MNAILNKNQAECSGSTIYTTLYPCNECAKLIIQSGIENVIYAQKKTNENPVFTTSERLLKVAGINTRRFERTETGPKEIQIDLESKSISMSRKSKDDDLSVNLDRIYL